MRELKDGIRSLVKLDFQGRVHKWFRGTDSDKRYANEIAVLKALEARNCPYVPRILEEHPEDLYFVSTNCGGPANGITRGKSDALFAELENDYGIRHEDPEPRNVTYNAKTGRFNLIDFELAAILEIPSASGIESSDYIRATWTADSRKGTTHKANDDFWLALQIDAHGVKQASTKGEVLLDPEHLILAVSDGMGGNAAGELASRLIMAWIRNHAADLYTVAQDDEQMQTQLEALVKDAHHGLNEIATRDPSLKGMGATLSLAYIAPGKIHVAHIGDSRIYLKNADSAEPNQLTIDHNDVWRDWKKGKISEVNYRMHPRRAALYDSMGGGHPHIRPQVESYPLQAPARLLLCTDGVTDGLWEKHFTAALLSESDICELRDEVLSHSYQNAGKDDTTLIIADLCPINSTLGA